jgi:hypothetical protein
VSEARVEPLIFGLSCGQVRWGEEVATWETHGFCHVGVKI